MHRTIRIVNNIISSMPSQDRITNQAIIQKLSALSRVFQKRFRTIYDQLDELTFLQFQTLLLVRDAGQTTTHQIASALQISPPSATALIERLVRLRWLQRIADSADRRVTQIVLSSTSQRRLDAILKKKFRHISSILDCLTPADRQHVYRIMTRLEGRMHINSATSEHA